MINDGRLQIDMSKGAPRELKVSADASTSPHDIYSVLVTYMGGAILHLSKKVGLAVASTHEAESVATVKASGACSLRALCACCARYALRRTYIAADRQPI